MEGQVSSLDRSENAPKGAVNATSGGGAVVVPLPSGKQPADRQALEAELRSTRSELERKAAELQRKAAELERRTAELECVQADFEQLAYVVSHDLSQPLTTVSGFAEMLSRRYRGQLDTDADEFIHFIVNGARRLHRMLDDLLTYSRVEGQANLNQPVDCSALVRNVLESFHPSIVDLDAKVSVGSLPTVSGSAEQLREVFRHLIANALEYTDGVAPRVEISGERDHHGFYFAVSDNGVGIKGRQAERIFEIFQRLHPHDSHTGAGLAICKRIVEKHGGSIWVESRPEGGSRFVFTIADRASSES
jgi:chemotaxis family two-component system sensor kinase Cph1